MACSLHIYMEILFPWNTKCLTVLNGERSGNSVGISYRFCQFQSISCQGSHGEDRSFTNPVPLKIQWKEEKPWRSSCPAAVTKPEHWLPYLAAAWPWEANCSESTGSISETEITSPWAAQPQTASSPGGIHWSLSAGDGQRAEGQGIQRTSAPIHTPLNSLTWRYRSKITLLASLRDKESYLCRVVPLYSVYYHRLVKYCSRQNEDTKIFVLFWVEGYLSSAKKKNKSEHLKTVDIQMVCTEL